MVGGPGISDEGLVLRYVMKGEQEIEAMRAAGRPKQYFTGDQPLPKLLEQLKKIECRALKAFDDEANLAHLVIAQRTERVRHITSLGIVVLL